MYTYIYGFTIIGITQIDNHIWLSAILFACILAFLIITTILSIKVSKDQDNKYVCYRSVIRHNLRRIKLSYFEVPVYSFILVVEAVVITMPNILVSLSVIVGLEIVSTVLLFTIFKQDKGAIPIAVVKILYTCLVALGL